MKRKKPEFNVGVSGTLFIGNVVKVFFAHGKTTKRHVKARLTIYESSDGKKWESPKCRS